MVTLPIPRPHTPPNLAVPTDEAARSLVGSHSTYGPRQANLTVSTDEAARSLAGSHSTYGPRQANLTVPTDEAEPTCRS